MVYETRETARSGARYFALILGIIYTLIGILGLIPGLVQPVADNPPLTVDTLYGNLLGIFPVNILHTLVHLAVGLWGIFAYRSYSASRTYARTIGILFLALFLFGLIPGLNTVFGLIPLFGADIWLHLATALLGLYFGFAGRSEAGEPAV